MRKKFISRARVYVNSQRFRIVNFSIPICFFTSIQYLILHRLVDCCCCIELCIWYKREIKLLSLFPLNFNYIEFLEQICTNIQTEKHASTSYMRLQGKHGINILHSSQLKCLVFVRKQISITINIHKCNLDKIHISNENFPRIDGSLSDSYQVKPIIWYWFSVESMPNWFELFKKLSF